MRSHIGREAYMIMQFLNVKTALPHNKADMWPCDMVYVAISSPPTTIDAGTMGGEIESRQGMYRVVTLKNTFHGHVTSDRPAWTAH
jgi:hypothetical protein